MDGPASATPIRIGIMCRSTTFPRWQADAIQHLLALDGVTIELLILDRTPSLPRPGGVRKLNVLPWLLWKFYSKRINRKSGQMRAVDLSGVLSQAQQLECAIIRKGRFSQYFKEEDIAQIREKNLDAILRFGFNIIRGDVLESARYGVWSFHHGDELHYRGQPAGFWEMVNGEPVTGSILQRLTNRLDGGIVLRKGFLKTHRFSFRKNRDQLYAESTLWPAAVCRDIQREQTDYFSAQPSRTVAKIYKNPRNFRMVGFLLKTAMARLKGLASSALFEPHWSIGVVDQRISDILENGITQPVVWLENGPSNTYQADPFGVENGDAIDILFEQFDYGNRTGTIAHSRFDGGFSSVQPAIDSGSHLSYPFLMKDGEGWVCLPEASKSGKWTAYRAKDASGPWEPGVSVFDAFPAGDATPVFFEDRWWLFLTNAEDGPNHKLQLYHGDSPLGPWRAHGGNPVKTDIRSSRPGGTPFVHKGQLFRPAQDSSEVYGGRLRIMRMTVLNTEEYVEEEARVIDPVRPGGRIHGIHTLSAAGRYTLIDGKRQRFVLMRPGVMRGKWKKG